MRFDRPGIFVTDGQDKSLIDQALDAFVYAPLGLLLEARDLIPKMADRGRGQVALTRLAGKVAQNQRRSDNRQASENPLAQTPNDDAQLPIVGYEDLSASELLPKLTSLDDTELGVILSYEQANRGRATVINKIHQLQA